MTKKIMFNDKFLLTKAVLDGRKTQTRRVIQQSEMDKINLFQKEYYGLTFDKLEGAELINHYYFVEKLGRPPYQIGEVVAVAQSYRDCGGFCENGVPAWEIISQKAGSTNAGWGNKMFVRAELMPHQIRITYVRVERLQDISDKCCLKEGVIEGICEGKDNQYSVCYYALNDIHTFCKPREAFAHLINKVSRKDVWSENPYVFVYDFELIK